MFEKCNKKVLILAFILLPIIIYISYYQITGQMELNRRLKDKSKDFPIAIEHFEEVKSDLEILRHGQFTQIGMNCNYDFNYKNEGWTLVILNEHEVLEGNKFYPLDSPIIASVIPPEEMSALLRLTTQSGVFSKPCIIGNVKDEIGISFRIDNRTMKIESYYNPDIPKRTCYIEPVDEDYYIKVSVSRLSAP